MDTCWNGDKTTTIKEDTIVTKITVYPFMKVLTINLKAADSGKVNVVIRALK